jgi:hypothetical protein
MNGKELYVIARSIYVALHRDDSHPDDLECVYTVGWLVGLIISTRYLDVVSVDSHSITTCLIVGWLVE